MNTRKFLLTIIWRSDRNGTAVTKRKVSGGSRSMERFKHTANLLTVVQTCRRQGRKGIDFFAQALLADSNDYLSRPSLLPKFET